MYKWVQWNRHKRVYDMTLAGACAAYLVVFAGATFAAHRGAGAIGVPIVAMRAFGTLAIVLLHVILCVGPVSRFTTLVAPILYNRRHLGVTMFFAALAHAAVAIGYYGGFGVRDPFSATLAGYSSFASVSGFPFEVLGFGALVILFVMAATSHDFWLANLSARVWQNLHMVVYVAYVLVVLHVVLGAMQSEQSPVYAAVLMVGVCVVVGLHIAAGVKEIARERGAVDPEGEWVDVGSVDEIEDECAKVVCLRERERIAVFRYGGNKVSAVSNVCAPGGPLGEGRVVGGCITCPWHGYQYLPDKGQSPPPYTETIATYQVRVEGRRILVNPRANAPGTPVEAAVVMEDEAR
ncbi:MAG: ferric reductase-like transmembrane domain-containing protein [Phycisphaerales bacterium]